jgi:hypothetical protein
MDVATPSDAVRSNTASVNKHLPRRCWLPLLKFEGPVMNRTLSSKWLSEAFDREVFILMTFV